MFIEVDPNRVLFVQFLISFQTTTHEVSTIFQSDPIHLVENLVPIDLWGAPTLQNDQLVLVNVTESGILNQP